MTAMSIAEPPPPPPDRDSYNADGGGGAGSASPSVGPPRSSPPPPVRGPSGKPLVIPPPTLRPQHVYAPQAPLGMVTLGIFGGKKKKKEGSENDLAKITTGWFLAAMFSFAKAREPNMNQVSCNLPGPSSPVFPL